MTSGKLCPVSTCMSANGTGAGQNALRARCSMTIESLPPLNSSTGRSNSPATSRMTWMPSDSRASSCVRVDDAHVCNPHSILEVPDQRPARGSSPGATARVQGAQPMDA